MTRHIVRFIPSWFPGGGFKRQAAIWRDQINEIESVPHDWAKQQIVSILGCRPTYPQDAGARFRSSYILMLRFFAGIWQLH